MKKIYLLIIFTAYCVYFSNAQTWLDFSVFHSGAEYVDLGNLNVPGHNITVEALITKTVADTGLLMQEDVVGKHLDTIDVNYLLRDWCFVMCTTSGYAVIENPIHLNLNTPYHIAATYDGDSVRYYVNGCEVSSLHFTGNMLQNVYPCAIGNRHWPRDEKYPGYINEVRIWNVTRTKQQIALNMDNLPSPTTQTGLLAYYKFQNDFKNVQGNATWNGTRQGLVDFDANPYWHGTLDNLCDLVYADFTSNKQNICTGNCINYIDNSVGATSWQWSFKGGTPAVSTDKNPQSVCYNANGLYDVTLVVSNNAGSDSITFTNYINVSDPPTAPVISYVGNTLYSSTDTSYISYQWYKNNVIIPGATDTSLTINIGGNYKVVVTGKNGCTSFADYTSIVGILNPLNHDNENAFVMYPNPASSELAIKQLWGKNVAATIEVYTITGKVLKTEKTKPFKEITLNIESLPKGVYLLKLTSDNGKWLGKFVKE